MGPTRRTPSRRGLGGWNLRALLLAVAGILHTYDPGGQLAGALRNPRFWLPADRITEALPETSFPYRVGPPNNSVYSHGSNVPLVLDS